MHVLFSPLPVVTRFSENQRNHHLKNNFFSGRSSPLKYQEHEAEDRRLLSVYFSELPGARTGGRRLLLVFFISVLGGVVVEPIGLHIICRDI